MTQYVLVEVSGTSLEGFNPAADSLLFPSSLSPRSLLLTLSGADTLLSIGSYNVLLPALAPDDFDGTQFIFGSGEFWRQGSGGADSLVGGLGADAFDLRAGGTDTVGGGDGDDVIDLGGTLDAADNIDGQGGQADVLKLAGDYADTLVLDGTMIRGVEKFVLGAGTFHLQLTNSLLASATPATNAAVLFDATAQTATDSVALDGSLVLKPFQALLGAGDDTVIGGARNDTLKGGAGANFVAGHGGNDSLEAASYGTSTLLGGLGDDNLAVTPGGIGASAVLLAGGTGSDSVTGGEGNDILYAAGWQDTLDEAATDEDWAVNRLSGGGGNDTLWGDAGRDTLLGGAGDDVLSGGVGQDSLDGGSGDDSLSAGDGNDTLDGGTGWDVLDGGAGNDEYVVRDSAQTVVERADGGDDTVTVYANDYTLSEFVEVARLMGDGRGLGGRLVGNAQDNTLTAWSGANTLEGGAGNDTLNGGWGVDSMTGGTGDDEYHLTAGDVVVEDADGGIDTVYISTRDGYAVPTEIENAILDGYGALTGNAKDNVLTSNGNTTMRGLRGNDTLTAGGGTLVGGVGDDTYVLRGGYGIVRELAGEGRDVVVSSGSHTLGANIEELVLDGSAYSGVGNNLDNVIRGSEIANYLSGKAGTDTLIGGDGNDIYSIDDGADVIIEDAGGGYDEVVASVDHMLAANVEKLTLYTWLGGPGLRGTGNALNNWITSETHGNDTLDGGKGADTMDGAEGDDLYLVDNVRDVVREQGWAGNDTVRSSVNYTLGDDIETLLLTTGSAAVRGEGNRLDNHIVGNASDNVLFGHDGNDMLDGGAGVDRLVGGNGDDKYFVDRAEDEVVEDVEPWSRDTVMSTATTYQLPANVENLILRGQGDIKGVGNDYANRLQGNDGNNFLDGGPGADTLIGGLGNDTYVVSSLDDEVAERRGGGVDTVLATVTVVLAKEVENLTLLGSDAIGGTGNALANLLKGNAAGNQLNGGRGADTLAGGRGDDTYVVDNLGDIVVETAGGGMDTVLASVSWVLGKNQENLTLAGTRDIAATGNAGDNVLRGNAGDNLLDGGLGADTMDGGSGDDTYVVKDVGDVVFETGTAGGSDTVVAWVSETLGENIENLVLAGDAVAGVGNDRPNYLEGNARDNYLEGDTANDSLSGGGGNDTLVGGLHADDLTGGAGSDRFLYRSALESNLSAYDLILDFARGADRIDLSQIDANTSLDGHQSLHFVAGTGGGVGEVWIETIDGGLALFANTDSDTAAEFVLLLAGVSVIDVTDLIL